VRRPPRPCPSRCLAHRLFSAAMALCFCVVGAGSAWAGSSTSIHAGHDASVKGHSCRCTGCRGAESCCCGWAHEPTKTTSGLPVTGSPALASAPCASPVPCGDTTFPVAGSRVHVRTTAILGGLDQLHGLATRPLLVPPFNVSLPSGCLSRLEDPPEGGLSLTRSR
jgi:hypothetical protein